MAKVKEVIEVVDQFSPALEKFIVELEMAAGVCEHFDEGTEKLKKAMDGNANTFKKLAEGALSKLSDMTKSAEENVSKLAGGEKSHSKVVKEAKKDTADFGQTMQKLDHTINVVRGAFQRLSTPIKEAFTNLQALQRISALYGKEAGDGAAESFAEAAEKYGRARSEIIAAGEKMMNMGAGNASIDRIFGLADRFSRLTGSDFNDAANAFQELIKSKSVSGIAEQMGGGERMERELQRAGVERKMRSGNLSGALDAVEKVMEKWGYTQEKADKASQSFTQKLDRGMNILKSRFFELFEVIENQLSPALSSAIDWITSPNVMRAFERMKNALSGIGDVIDSVVGIAREWGDVIVGAAAAFVAVKVATLAATKAQAAFNAVTAMHPAVRIFTMASAAVLGFGTLLKNMIKDNTGESLTALEAITAAVASGIGFWAADIKKFGLTWLAIFDGIWRSVNEFFAKIKAGWMSMILEAAKAVSKIPIIGEAVDLSGLEATQAESMAKAKDWEQPSKYWEEARSIDRKQIGREWGDKAVAGLREIKETLADSLRQQILGNNTASQNMETMRGMFWFMRTGGDALKKHTKGTDDNTGKMKALMMQQQDIKWLKEYAEKTYVNKINMRQVSPNVVINMNKTNSTPQDVERQLDSYLRRQAAISAAGAY